MNKLNHRGKANNISTFDFATLYTKIEHENLLCVLYKLIDLGFKGGRRSNISFNGKRASWVSKPLNKRYFTKSTLKSTVKFLIENCFFEVGDLILRQKIGIPMGIDPAPFWANLYLHWYEGEFMKTLIQNDKLKAFSFNGNSRYSDDLICINGGDSFLNSYKDIYPSSLELKLEHSGSSATFLDLDITIVSGKFKYKLFDKRESFPFHIVRMPHLDSNIPSFIFYSSIFSEFLRIARCCLYLDDFICNAHALFTRMKNQGGNERNIIRQVNRLKERYPNTMEKYNKPLGMIASAVKTGTLPR